jgi:ABC-2 type transport system ATP-binding protein
MQPLIEVAHLSRQFGMVRAVDDVSFAVHRGEVVGFLGPNGAGKTTTMRMIAGFLSLSGGQVRIAGIDITQRPVEAKRALGYLPEGAPLYSEMTVSEFLRFVAAARGLTGGLLKQRVAHVTDLLELGPMRGRRIEALSKGFKRRVGIAQALVHDPQVLILDEPTDGLDPNQKRQMRALIADMAPDKAILISTHLLEEVDAVCARVLVIANGRIKADATPAALAGQAKDGMLESAFRILTLDEVA